MRCILFTVRYHNTFKCEQQVRTSNAPMPTANCPAVVRALLSLVWRSAARCRPRTSPRRPGGCPRWRRCRPRSASGGSWSGPAAAPRATPPCSATRADPVSIMTMTINTKQCTISIIQLYTGSPETRAGSCLLLLRSNVYNAWWNNKIVVEGVDSHKLLFMESFCQVAW